MNHQFNLPNAGLIYVLYETPQQRLAGELALNGAWFEGKKITATGARARARRTGAARTLNWEFVGKNPQQSSGMVKLMLVNDGKSMMINDGYITI